MQKLNKNAACGEKDFTCRLFSRIRNNKRCCLFRMTANLLFRLLIMIKLFDKLLKPIINISNTPEYFLKL